MDGDGDRAERCDALGYVCGCVRCACEQRLEALEPTGPQREEEVEECAAMAAAALEAERYETAAEAFEMVLRARPDHADALHGLGVRCEPCSCTRTAAIGIHGLAV